jgi:hypothetical protein
MPRLLLFFRLGKIFIFSANIRNLLLPIQFEEDTKNVLVRGENKYHFRSFGIYSDTYST